MGYSLSERIFRVRPIRLAVSFQRRRRQDSQSQGRLSGFEFWLAVLSSDGRRDRQCCACILREHGKVYSRLHDASRGDEEEERRSEYVPRSLGTRLRLSFRNYGRVL